MFFGIQRNYLNALLTLLKSTGLTPLCLEPAPISLMRLLRQTGQLAPGQVAAVLLVEKDTATINIARDDLLYLSRNVSILNNPNPSESGQDPSAELLQAFIHETRVSIDYYRRRFLGEPGVSKVILFGKATDPKRVEELTSALDLPVEVGDPFKRMAVGKEIPSGLAVATGLALRGLDKKAGGEPNLLLPEYQRQLEGILKPMVLRGIAALVALILWYGTTAADLTSHRQMIATLRQNRVVPPGVNPDSPLAELQRFQEARQAEFQFLRELDKNQGGPRTLLRELTRLLPKEAWLQQAVLEDTLSGQNPDSLSSLVRRRVVRLTGSSYARDRDKELEGINFFLTNLRSSPHFSTAFAKFNLDTVQRGRFQEEEITEFRISCLSSSEQTP